MNETLPHTCNHLQFIANVNVDNVIIGNETAFLAQLRIQCAECGKPMEFIGVDRGLSFQQPSMSDDKIELRLPLRPLGEVALDTSLPGFASRAQELPN